MCWCEMPRHADWCRRKRVRIPCGIPSRAITWHNILAMSSAWQHCLGIPPSIPPGSTVNRRSHSSPREWNSCDKMPMARNESIFRTSSHSRDEERPSLTAREARCQRGEEYYQGEAQPHPSYEKAGEIDRWQRRSVEWQKKRREQTDGRAAPLAPNRDAGDDRQAS